MQAIQLVVVASLALACGGDTGHTYPRETVDNFMNACTAKGTPASACDCALDEIRQRYTAEEYAELEARVARNEPEAVKTMADVASGCQGK